MHTDSERVYRIGGYVDRLQRRRREREQLWIEFAYEEKDEAAERREEDALRQRAARKEELRRTVHQQMDELQRRRQRQQEEKHFQHLLVGPMLAWKRISFFFGNCSTSQPIRGLEILSMGRGVQFWIRFCRLFFRFPIRSMEFSLNVAIFSFWYEFYEY